MLTAREKWCPSQSQTRVTVKYLEYCEVLITGLGKIAVNWTSPCTADRKRYGSLCCSCAPHRLTDLHRECLRKAKAEWNETARGGGGWKACLKRKHVQKLREALLHHRRMRSCEQHKICDGIRAQRYQRVLD